MATYKNATRVIRSKHIEARIAYFIAFEKEHDKATLRQLRRKARRTYKNFEAAAKLEGKTAPVYKSARASKKSK